jgi:hypothetical protein
MRRTIWIPGGLLLVSALPFLFGAATTTSQSAPIIPAPPLTLTNKAQVKLGFDVLEVGSSGVDAVDVYVTTDDGVTWERVPGEPDVSLPTRPDAKGTVHGTVTVSLPREGKIYGYYLVVKNRAGRGQQCPHAGVPPQLRVELDQTPPEARLFAPQPVPNAQDSLLLTWEAEDRNLLHEPVTLEWAASTSGPWVFIGGPRLPNTGNLIWTIPAGAPSTVYLRLTVRDGAGNVAVAQTQQPVVIDLKEPRVANVVIEH